MKKLLVVFMAVILLFSSVGMNVIAVDAEEITEEDYIEVVVPAIWYPVDKNTNEVLSYLNPIPTIPDMYPRSEVAKLNDAIIGDYHNSEYDGQYMIDYMGVPKPLSEGSWSANNFMYTANLFFTDRFHRVVAQGRDPHNFGEETSAVRKLEYSEFSDEAVFNEGSGKYTGLLGFKNTPYQEGETMRLYIATETEDVSLSEADFAEAILQVIYDYDNEAMLVDLYNNIKEVNFNDFDNWAQITTLDGINDQEGLKQRIDTIYLFKYDSLDSDNGSFITEGDGYKNFAEDGFSSLEPGKYEVVFPIYWSRNVPEYMSAPDVFSRNRYQYDDTIHYTMNFQLPKTEVNVSKIWNDNENQDGIRPEEVTIKLLADEEPTDKTLTLNSANNWTGSFTDLNVYAAGQAIDYTVEEVSIAGYSREITGSMENGFIITNSHTPQPTTKPTTEPTTEPATTETVEPLLRKLLQNRQHLRQLQSQLYRHLQQSQNFRILEKVELHFGYLYF